MGRFILILLILMLAGVAVTEHLVKQDAGALLQAAMPDLAGTPNSRHAPDSLSEGASARALVSPGSPPFAPLSPRVRASIREQLTLEGHNSYLDSLLLASDSMLRRWPEAPDVPLTVSIAHPGWDSRGVDLTNDVQRALDVWSGLGLGFRFSVRDDTTGVDILFTWVEGLEKNRTGETNLSWDRSGSVRRARVLLALRGPDGEFLTEAERRTVALHEIGHALGLPHSGDTGDVMYPASRQGALSPRDRETLRLLYSLPLGSIKGSGPGAGN